MDSLAASSYVTFLIKLGCFRMTKIGRNQVCDCGSGIKYKYCCIGKKLKSRNVDIPLHVTANYNPTDAESAKDFINMFACAEIPLKNFCKDNDFYLFGSGTTVANLINFTDLLQKGRLTKDILLANYKQKITYEDTIAYFNDAATFHPAINSRLNILKDATEAHFNGKYTLSVPTLFAQIEGILREYGNLKASDNFKSTMKTDIWDTRYLFSLSDNADYFNGFISRLFEGQKDSVTFNRNTILHGLNATYDSEEWSLTLLLIILEIRLFLWFEKKTLDVFDRKPDETGSDYRDEVMTSDASQPSADNSN